MLPLQSRKTGNALLSQPQVDGHEQQHFTLLQFHLAAVCSCHAFNIPVSYTHLTLPTILLV